MRCPRCGNESPETNRFCGMCGATLLQSPTAATTTAGSAAQSASTHSPAAPGLTPPRNAAPSRTTSSERRDESEAPVISGPSFLGLNEPRKRASLSVDPHAAPSARNLDYLLEDDEESKGGGGKFILILVALALAVGLGYLRWKDQGFGWLGTLASKHTAAVAKNSDDTSSTAPPSSSNTDTTSPSAASQPASGTPAAQSTTDSASPAPSPAAAPAPAATPPASTPAAEDASPVNAAANPLASTPTPSTPAAATPAPLSAASETPAAEKSTAPADVPAAKPPAPPRPIDPVSEAQKYIYGRGVRQDCDRGIKLLKPAADHSNPKAMIEMGALYSAGLCTPRDLPTAYRWFAMALRKQPDNQSVQTDLQKLWSEMTQPERQLAIKMSQ